MEIEKNKPYPLINPLECKSCSRCVVACPKQCLRIGKTLNERGYYSAEYTGEGCVGCASCFYSCPEPNAIEIHIPQRD
jgi:NAD-dependent dihydropyrimidine dehydrogenase PreA subunit